MSGDGGLLVPPWGTSSGNLCAVTMALALVFSFRSKRRLCLEPGGGGKAAVPRSLKNGGERSLSESAVTPP